MLARVNPNLWIGIINTYYQGATFNRQQLKKRQQSEWTISLWDTLHTWTNITYISSKIYKENQVTSAFEDLATCQMLNWLFHLDWRNARLCQQFMGLAYKCKQFLTKALSTCNQDSDYSWVERTLMLIQAFWMLNESKRTKHMFRE